MRIMRLLWARFVHLALWLRPGTRGHDMLLIAAIWIIIGLDLVENGDPDPAHKLPIEYLGHEVRVGIWFFAAGAATVSVWFPRGADRWGFAVLIVPPALRMLSYGVAFIFSPLGDPIGHSGYGREALVWTLITAVVVRMAARPEMPPRVRRKFREQQA